MTATATDNIKKDVIKNLMMQDHVEFKSSFNRANLYFEVRDKTDLYINEIARIIINEYKG